ncbi:uncharacterized protein LOC135199365 [Macrobrachium nipponense]|uniref:uncharacterized protein LOC135199365 n=1 Tax=Macrobrachium nipponense TaxID=159736 RepID=UPI0030C884A3
MNSNNASLLRDALLDDGRFVLQPVVAKLYRGGRQRPDFFFKNNAKLQHKRYDIIFSRDQRAAIERSGSSISYDISSASEQYDVSLLALLAEHACGLPSSDPLLKKALEVRSKRNTVCHNGGNSVITDAALGEELNDLLELYIEILDLLEERSYSDLSSEKMKVRLRIEEKRKRVKSSYDDDSRAVALYTSLSRASPVRTSSLSSTKYRCSHDEDDDDDSDSNYYYYSQPTTRFVSHRSATSTNSSSEIPTWGKVAMGVAGIAALGIAGAAAANSTNRNERSKQERRDEECAVM